MTEHKNTPGSIQIKVNGEELEVSTRSTILEALRECGVEVPTLCHDERIKPASACRICEVKVGGQARPVCACATPVEAGMTIETHTPELEHFRRATLTLLGRHYPAKALEAADDKPFHRLLRQYQITPPSGEAGHARLADMTHPYIAIEMDRCINCYRCVRICEQLQGQFVWKIQKRGDDTQVVPDSDGTLLASSCVSCGACVDTCPTGALEDKSLHEHGAIESWVRTTCPYCGTGCELNVGVADDRIAVIRPVLDAPVSKGHLCVKGRYASGFVDAPQRITEPMIKDNGNWRNCSWQEAIGAAAQALTEARSAAGPDALGVLGSARATNEESYLAQKFARMVLGTNNVDCCARVCHAPSAAGLALVFGTGAATNSFDDIEKAQGFLVVGANPTENHPIVGARIKQRAIAGIPLIVIDPRKTELARYATIHLAPRPGTNIPLFHALAKVLLDEKLADLDFLSRRTMSFDAYAASLVDWTAERAAGICGVAAEDIRKAARLYASCKPAMSFHGLGVTEHIQGTDGVIALAQLALLTGNIGKAGAGVNPLRGQNNVQGTATMGCEPQKLTGSAKLEAARALHESVWAHPIPRSAGMDLLQMMDAAAEGRLKALFAIGYDILLTNPDMDRTAMAMRKLDALVVVDLFLTETAREFGTVFLPAASSFEKDGTFMNAERRIQRVRKALRPRGNSKTDSEILSLLAARMGCPAGFAYPDAEAIWNEIRAVWPAAAGISYPRIETGGLQWPCPSSDHPGETILHRECQSPDQRFAFRVIPYRETPEQTDAEFPLLLNTGRSLYHFNAATMTGPTKNRELLADDLVQIHPADAARLQITEKSGVVIESRHGSFIGRAWITETVRKGELFSTFHNVAARVNRATGKGRDATTHTPEYKVTAVRIRPLQAGD